MAGLFEGLVARDIRKFTGGHESAYVFHKSQTLDCAQRDADGHAVPDAAPSVPPALLFAPTMLLTAGMVYIAASRFKKFV